MLQNPLMRFFLRCLIGLSLLLTASFRCVNGRMPTTLDGAFESVTVPLDKNFRGKARDLPKTDRRVQKIGRCFDPEQISISLSLDYDLVWISWITGDFQIGDNIKPLHPETVASIVNYGEFELPLTNTADGYSLVYNQLYPFECLNNYTSEIIHHVRLAGLKADTLYQYQCGDPFMGAMSDDYISKRCRSQTVVATQIE